MSMDGWASSRCAWLAAVGLWAAGLVGCQVGPRAGSAGPGDVAPAIWTAEEVAAQVQARAAAAAGSRHEPAGAEAAEPLVSNAWIETDVKQVLTDLAAQVRTQILIDLEVQGTVTLTLDRVPLAAALERITLPLGLAATPFGGGWLLGSLDQKAAAYPYLVTTTVYAPRHRRADELRGLLPEVYASAVKADGKRNVLLITTAASLLPRIQETLERLDRPPRQLVIEAIVVDLSRQALDELGISWEGKTRAGQAVGTVSAAGSALTWSGPIGSLKLLASLKALETNSQARVIAAPRILTLEGEPANLFIGTEQYFSFQSGPVNFPFITVEKVPAGIELDLTVSAATEDAVIVDVKKAEASTAVPTADNRPLVNRRRAATHVRIPNGGTIAIGGLRQRSDAESYEGVPWLARIPVSGALAGSRRWKSDENELVMFVSATIGDAAEQWMTN